MFSCVKVQTVAMQTDYYASKTVTDRCCNLISLICYQTCKLVRIGIFDVVSLVGFSQFFNL